MSVGPLGTVEVKYDCKLDGVKDDAATVSIKGNMELKTGKPDGDLPIKITKLDMKTDKFTGTYKFDTKAGRPLDSKIEMNMAGTMTIEANGQTVDAKLKQKMTTTSVVSDKNPLKD